MKRRILTEKDFKIMHRYILLLLICTPLTMTTCSKAASTEPPSGPNSEPNFNPGRTITINEAINNLFDFMDGLEGGTRGLTKNLDSFSIYTVGNKESVKSFNPWSNLPDTLAYIVNFGDGCGAAVLSANTRIQSPVICVLDSGELNPDEFVLLDSSANTDIFLQSSDTIDISTLLMMGIVSLFEDGGEPHEDDIEHDDTNPDFNDMGPGFSPGGHDGQKYGPYITTKWHQRDPFNNLVSPRALGCVATAVAQIIVYLRPDVNMNFNGKQCNWDTLKTVCHYQDYMNSGTDEAKNQAANFCYTIQDSNNCNITSDGVGTSYGAKNTFENFGLSNVHIYYSYSLENIQPLLDSARKQIIAGRPVYMSGHNPTTNNGHAFILDGIYYFGNNLHFHINWGWNGNSDGYFVNGIFNTSQRIERDSMDVNPSTGTHLYEVLFNIITYD